MYGTEAWFPFFLAEVTPIRFPDHDRVAEAPA